MGARPFSYECDGCGTTRTDCAAYNSIGKACCPDCSHLWGAARPVSGYSEPPEPPFDPTATDPRAYLDIEATHDEEALVRALRENRCGDLLCQSLRLNGAIHVLTGLQLHGKPHNATAVLLAAAIEGQAGQIDEHAVSGYSEPGERDREAAVEAMASVLDTSPTGRSIVDALDANPEAAATLAAYLRGASPQPPEEAAVRDWSAWLIEREPGEDVDGQQPEYWAGSTRWGVAVRQDWTIDPFKARHFTTSDEAASVIGDRLGFGRPVMHRFTGHPAPPSAASITEIAAGLTELGTGGTPAFIRGYNRGFEDAFEQSGGASPQPKEPEAGLREAAWAFIAEWDKGFVTAPTTARFRDALSAAEYASHPTSTPEAPDILDGSDR